MSTFGLVRVSLVHCYCVGSCSFESHDEWSIALVFGRLGSTSGLFDVSVGFQPVCICRIVVRDRGMYQSQVRALGQPRFGALDFTCSGLDLRIASTCECQHAKNTPYKTKCMHVPNSVWVVRCSAPKAMMLLRCGAEPILISGI